MYIISLLVHEKKDIILEQLLNIQKYFSSAKVVVHVSKSANFTLSELEEYLKGKVDNYHVNPNQAQTTWGGIISAHFLNIKYIYNNISSDAHVLFHSSNDMFVKLGIEEYLKGKDYLFNFRRVNSFFTYWWVGAVAKQDKKLLNLLKLHNSSMIIGSQIEGSMYKIDLLMRIIELCEKHDLLESQLHYPREEIVFSSLANALNIKSDGLPYVLSEVHRFDSKLWKFFMKYKRIHRNDLLRKIVNAIFFRSKFYEIKPKDIEAIRNNNIKYLEKFEYLYDGDNKWKIFDSNNLFAVKRVERDINNPLRIYIRGLN